MKGNADCHIFSENGRKRYDDILWDSDAQAKEESDDDVGGGSGKPKSKDEEINEIY